MSAKYWYSGQDTQFPRASSVITLVQATCASTAGPTTTAAVTLPSVIAGHLMVVSVRYGSAGGLGSTTTSVSDGTTTFTPLTEKTISNGSGFSTEARLFYLLSSNASGGTATFTVTLGAVRTNVVVCVWDFSSTNPFTFDVETGSTGFGTAATSGSLSTTGLNEVVTAQLGTILTPGTGDTPSSPLINGSPPDASNTATVGDMAWEKVFLSPFNGAASATLSASDSWVLAAAAFKANIAVTGAVDDGGWIPFFMPGVDGTVTIGPSLWADGNWEAPVPSAASLEGGDGNINDITAKLWPVPPSRFDPWIGEQLEWPTTVQTTPANDETDILALLRAPFVVPPPVSQAPFPQQDDDLPFLTAIDDGGWAPIITVATVGPSTVDPSSWINEDVIPSVQPTAPPVEDWDPLRLMGLPVVVPPPSRGPDFWTLDELIGNPPVDEGIYELPLHFVVVPDPQRPVDWSWINQLAPTPIDAPAVDEPGTLDWLRVAQPVYTVFDRNFLFDLDQDFPILVPVVPEIVDSPTRLLVLNYQSTLLLVLDENGNPMAQPLIITQGEAGPLSLACAGANHDRQTLTDTTVTLRLVSENGVVYANAVPLTIVSATDGVVLWNRLPAQVQDPGDYHYQVKVLFTDGTFKYFPDANPRKGNPLEILEAV